MLHHKGHFVTDSVNNSENEQVKWKHISRNIYQHYENDGHNGTPRLHNPHIHAMHEDVLYHLALSTKTHDLKAMFGDVKFVCMGGSPRRMEHMSYYLLKELNLQLPAGTTLVNIANATDRYALYKVGPVLVVSHGMGVPSISILLNEMLKLLYYAGAQDVIFFRLGTCGGLGVKPGSVIVSESAVDGLLKPHMEMPVLGRMKSYPAELNKDLAHEVRQCCTVDDEFSTIPGITMCTDDFYEGQGRLDGAFCEYTKAEKMEFLRHAHDQGVRNIEMESLCFAAMCNRAGIKCAVLCVAIVDRLQGDQVSTPHNTMVQWSQRPLILVSRFIKKQLDGL